MLNNNPILDKPTKYFLILSLIIYISVMLINDGFMALDEYWVGITRYIPAQTSTLQNLVTSDDVKSPLQMLPMHGVAQMALKLGVESAYLQYRVVIFVLGLINFLLLSFAFLEFSRVRFLSRRQTNLLFLMLTFYFAAPFAFTRPMYESIAAPWLCLATVWAIKYDQNKQLKDLLWGVCFASTAFVLRQQLGFCALIFIFLTLLKKEWKHFFAASALGLFIFILVGIPDYFLRGQFHFSLLNLTIYNYQHGSDYGQKPLTFYPALIILMCWTPFFIKKYPFAFLKDYFFKSKSLWGILFLFVFLHSLFPQKWERFLISVIPILIFLVFPFLDYLQNEFKINRWRLISLYSFNGLIFFIASYFPPQKNLIEMSLYLNEHPEIQKVYRLNDTPGWITEAFIEKKNFIFEETNLEGLQKVDWSDCHNTVVVAEHDLQKYDVVLQKLSTKASFNVNLIEQWAYRMNPKNNARRVKLHLFSGCIAKN